MAPTTRAGLLVLVLSLPIWAGGIWLVRDARTRQPPVAAAHRTLPGSVVEIIATPCSARRSAGTCSRTVAAYVDGGQSRQVVSLGRYRPARHQRGEALSVIVDANGTAWIDIEWQDRQAERLRRFEDGRRFPLVMGWILIGCASFSVLLGLGLIFWVDRSVRPSNGLASVAMPMMLLTASATGSGLRQDTPTVPTIRMADGRLWTARNLDVATGDSYCYVRD